MKKTKNSFGIRFLTSGPPRLVAVLNEIIAALDACRVQRSVDIDATGAANGTLLSLRNPLPVGGSRSVGIKYPLDLTLLDAGGTYTGTFRPGTVNGLIPSNFLGLTGISKTGTVYVWLNVTLANAQVTAAIFAQGGSTPTAFPTSKGTPPTTLMLLTHVIVSGTVFRVIGLGSPFLTPIGIFTTDKAGTISPGELPVDQWYSYQLEIRG